MRPFLKPRIIAFALCSVAVVVSLIWWARRDHAYASVNVARTVRLAIHGDISTLKREDWNQSVENLLTNDWQFNRSLFHGDTMGESLVLEDLFSVRRAVKILNTLESERMKQRVAKCEELFDRVLKHHKEVMRENMQKTEDRTGKPPVVNPVVPRRYPPKHTLCLAMFATAETGRIDILAKQFQELDEFEKEVRERVDRVNIPEYSQKRSEFPFFPCVPDYRSQVNILRRVALKHPDLLPQVDAYIDEQGYGRDLLVVPWNVRTTVGTPPAFSQGKTIYRLFCWDDHMLDIDQYGDLQQDIVFHLREMVFGGPEGVPPGNLPTKN